MHLPSGEVLDETCTEDCREHSQVDFSSQIRKTNVRINETNKCLLEIHHICFFFFFFSELLGFLAVYSS